MNTALEIGSTLIYYEVMPKYFLTIEVFLNPMGQPPKTYPIFEMLTKVVVISPSTESHIGKKLTPPTVYSSISHFEFYGQYIVLIF
jgi:hypothetical protein